MKIKIEQPNGGVNSPERIAHLTDLALSVIRDQWPMLSFGAVNLYVVLRNEDGDAVEIGSPDEDGHVEDPIEILVAREDRKSEPRPRRGGTLVIKSDWPPEEALPDPSKPSDQGTDPAPNGQNGKPARDAD